MEQESKLKEWLDEYYRVFGWNYPLSIMGTKPINEIIDDIKECVQLGRKAGATNG